MSRRWVRVLVSIVEIGTIVIALPLLLLWCSVPNPARLADENPTSTAFIDLRRADAEDAGKPLKLKWEWRPIGRISRYLRAAVIYAEDMSFYSHDGVDWDAIADAAVRDFHGERIGGSTITQQLAKNLYLSPKRSYWRKAREMLTAFALEDHLSKQRILELYLNVVEWGDGVFGAEAAAKKWFGHSAQSLSPAEAARLAIALPNPIQRAPNVHTAELTKKAVRIIRLFRMQGLVNAAQEREALESVGATGEIVLPDRGSQPPASPDRGSQPPASPEREPPASPERGDPPPSPDSGDQPPAVPSPP